MVIIEHFFIIEELRNVFSNVLRNRTDLINDIAFKAAVTASVKIDKKIVEIDFLSTVLLLLCTRYEKDTPLKNLSAIFEELCMKYAILLGIASNYLQMNSTLCTLKSNHCLVVKL